MTTASNEPLKLFYCYAHEDKALRDELDAHLAGMKRQKLLEVRYDRQIMPGTHWEHEIDKNLTSAHIIADSQFDSVYTHVSTFLERYLLATRV